jgi:glycosyltransferase involved in cell wall biosynthesis
VLWICGLPKQVEDVCFNGENHGAQAAWSWITAHLPAPKDIELHVACLWPGGAQYKSVTFKGARFHLLPCPRRGRALFFFQRDPGYFRPLLEKLKPDLVHGWGTEDSFGLVARRLAPKQHVIGIQGLIQNYYKYLPKTYRTVIARTTERITLKKARYVVAESCYSLNSAAPLCPQAVKRVIEQPVRPEFLEAPPSDGMSKTILFVGSIEKRKGIMDAIVAFSKVAADGWAFHVVGKGRAENERQMYQLVTEAGINPHFRHSRNLDTLSLVRAMRESSIFLLPTFVDTGPNALKEALTMGLWPVCYDNSGPAEYIRKYSFGSLAIDRDVDSLSTKLKEALTDLPRMDLNRDLNRREELARRSRRDFSREQAWEQLIEFYEMIVSNA